MPARKEMVHAINREFEEITSAYANVVSYDIRRSKKERKTSRELHDDITGLIVYDENWHIELAKIIDFYTPFLSPELASMSASLIRESKNLSNNVGRLFTELYSRSDDSTEWIDTIYDDTIKILDEMNSIVGIKKYDATDAFALRDGMEAGIVGAVTYYYDIKKITPKDLDEIAELKWIGVSKFSHEKNTIQVISKSSHPSSIASSIGIIQNEIIKLGGEETFLTEEELKKIKNQ